MKNTRKLRLLFLILIVVSIACGSPSNLPGLLVTETQSYAKFIPPTKLPNVDIRECFSSTEYSNEVTQIVTQWQISLNDFSFLAKKADQDPNIIVDRYWRANLEKDLTIVDNVAQKVLNLKPPVGFLNIDKQLKFAATESILFTSDVREGIYKTNTHSISSASNHLHNFYGYLRKATEFINQMSEIDDSCP